MSKHMKSHLIFNPFTLNSLQSEWQRMHVFSCGVWKINYFSNGIRVTRARREISLHNDFLCQRHFFRWSIIIKTQESVIGSNELSWLCTSHRKVLNGDITFVLSPIKLRTFTLNIFSPPFGNKNLKEYIVNFFCKVRKIDRLSAVNYLNYSDSRMRNYLL